MAYSANKVFSGLWQGAAPSDHDVKGKYDMVVLAAQEWQPALSVYSVLRVPLDDAELSEGESRLALHASRAVSESVRRGEHVLVTCHMGLNRSGLISALALMRLGMSSTAAIETVRRARGEYALSNASFVRFLNRVR